MESNLPAFCHTVRGTVLILSIGLTGACLVVPSQGPLTDTLVAAFFWVISALMVVGFIYRAFWTRDYHARRQAERIRLGCAAWCRRGAFVWFRESLVFVVAFRFAEVSALWAVFAAFCLLVSTLLIVSSLPLPIPYKSLPRPEASEGDLNRCISTSRRMLPVGGLLLVVWFYAWWGAAAVP